MRKKKTGYECSVSLGKADREHKCAVDNQITSTCSRQSIVSVESSGIACESHSPDGALGTGHSHRRWFCTPASRAKLAINP